MREYERYDPLGLAELVRNGDTSPEDLLNAALARVRERNPRLDAVNMEAGLVSFGRTTSPQNVRTCFSLTPPSSW